MEQQGNQFPDLAQAQDQDGVDSFAHGRSLSIRFLNLYEKDNYHFRETGEFIKGKPVWMGAILGRPLPPGEPQILISAFEARNRQNVCL
jgi:hypothetical protein